MPAPSSLQRGIAAARARDAAAAVQFFRDAVVEDPANAVAQAWLGQALCAEGQRLEGSRYLSGAAFAMLAAKPPAADRIVEIITQLQSWGEMAAAAKVAASASRVLAGDARVHRLLAVACAQLGRPEQALLAGAEALRLAPDQPMLEVLLASLEIDSGKLEDAAARLQRTLAAAGKSSAAVTARYRAYKEVARLRDRQGDADGAFTALEAAAGLARTLPEFQRVDRSLVPRAIAANIGVWDTELLGRWTALNSANRRAPVFLMGFFRSGTTLVQAILAAHPDVFVADEGNMLQDMLSELHRLDPSSNTIAAKLARLDASAIERLRGVYWDRARGRYGELIDRPVFVDKFTLATIDVALINCVFPEARVIFLQRDPRDVCLSCFQQLMVPTPATVHLLEWRSTAQLYAAVNNWWFHIRPRLTLPWCEIRYEALIGDFEAEVTQLLAFLGLGWRSELADFHIAAAGTYISSPSRNQVRRPLYASSVGRWRAYARHFVAIEDLLAPFVARLGY